MLVMDYLESGAGKNTWDLNLFKKTMRYGGKKNKVTVGLCTEGNFIKYCQSCKKKKKSSNNDQEFFFLGIIGLYEP